MDQVPVAESSVPDEQSRTIVETTTILDISWNNGTWTLDVDVGMPVLLVLSSLLVLTLALRLLSILSRGAALEIDQADIGVGETKISLRPNQTDRQVAYAIWVELSTRKIGLPIDLDDDVIIEIYDSWYSYFSVTRELIKTVSVSKVRNKSTRQIINLSIDVLNNGLRPHLTKWQARYRHWYDRQIDQVDETATDRTILDPQLIQKKFPKYAELSGELAAVNARLIAYRQAMQKLVFDLK